MTIEVLVKNQDRTRIRDGVLVGDERGDIAAIKDQPCVWGAREGLPWFVRFIVSNTTRAQAEQYLSPWELDLDFTVNSVDDVARTATLTAVAKKVSASAYEFGDGGITRAKLETWLNKWAATVDGTSSNAVQYTVDLDAALISVGLWGGVADDLSVEINDYQSRVYDCTFTHPPQWNQVNVTKRVEEVGGAVLDQGSGFVRVSLSLVDMRREMESDFRRKVFTVLRRQQYKVSSAACDAAEAAGGVLEATKAAFIDQIQDKLL